jgi:hypothetical protein
MKASLTDENIYSIQPSGKTPYKVSKSQDEYSVKISNQNFYKSKLTSDPFVIVKLN